MRKLISSLEILSVTPEVWLDFSPGQNTDTNLRRSKSRGWVEFPRQVLALLNFWLSMSSVIGRDVPRKDVLMFASTRNQLSVLAPILKCRSDDSLLVTNAGGDRMSCYDNRAYSVRLDLLSVIQVILLTVIRLPFLLRDLLKKNPELISRRLKSFCSCYFWLIYHQQLLDDVTPKLVIFANDHNPECRALLELCKARGIVTIYVPHAAVSKRFHAIDFDHSFLDGYNAVDIYTACEGRRAPLSRSPKTRRYYVIGGLRTKNLQIAEEALESGSVGLAVKGTDDLAYVRCLLKTLRGHYKVTVRWHPNVGRHYVSDLRRLVGETGFQISDPNQEAASTFLRNNRYIVSGNSTLLLEAAITGVIPIYLKTLSAGVPDYYGFVRRGICFESEDEYELLLALSRYAAKNFSPSREGLKYFYGSFGTSFWRHEANVASEIIDYILDPSLSLSYDDLDMGCFR